ncbi:MAG: phosphatase PAP2 family protein [Deltaproteobacteria bacterium]|nr:phosphatase PAP2 family protein [Deltaproteobacteria bacterium]MBI3017447.1 phosphatase PAP2 family protein [Deltaproteobacteria bacterium]
MTAISTQFRLKMIVALSACFAVGYGYTNHFPVFTPWELPVTAVDRFFGFHPWTIWIYMSDYILIFLPAILVTHVHVMKRLLKAYLVNFAIHFPIFFFFPTILPWEFRRYPIEGPILNAVFQFLWIADGLVNCFPSQHVSLCFVVAIGFWNYRRCWSWIMIIWSILISLSTLTTKQHYSWDVLGGLLVTLVVYWMVYRKKEDPKIQLVSPSK